MQVSAASCGDEPLEIRYDRGSPRWLAEERAHTIGEGMRVTRTGTEVPARFGPVTAYLNRRALFPVDLIKARGLSGEEGAGFYKEKLAPLMDYMGKKEHLPLYNKEWRKEMPPRWEQYAPFVLVWADGSWWLNEGNHRVEAARRLGWRYIPLEIRWFSGGEDYRSPWGHTPGVVAHWDEQAHAEGYCVEGFRAFP